MTEREALAGKEAVAEKPQATRQVALSGGETEATVSKYCLRDGSYTISINRPHVRQTLRSADTVDSTRLH